MRSAPLSWTSQTGQDPMATTPAATGWGLLVGTGVPGFADARDAGVFPLPDGLPGEGEACLERISGIVGALSRVQPGSVVAQPPRAAGTSKGYVEHSSHPVGALIYKYISSVSCMPDPSWDWEGYYRK